MQPSLFLGIACVDEHHVQPTLRFWVLVFLGSCIVCLFYSWLNQNLVVSVVDCCHKGDVVASAVLLKLQSGR